MNKYDVTFICVPTPKADNDACDTSIVEYVLEWVSTPYIVIIFTVPVGFTESMKNKYSKKIFFQPEYYGETVVHPFADIKIKHDNYRW